MGKANGRRSAVKNLVRGSAGLIFSSQLLAPAASNGKGNDFLALKGNINHSVCHWTYGFMSVEELCKVIRDIGFNALDLMSPKDWPTLQKYGVYSSMCQVAGNIKLTEGFNRRDLHSMLAKEYQDVIQLMVKAGYKNVICFSGNRNGMDDETGLENCEAGIKRFLALAEKNNIVVHMELLNSKVDHKDYMCDNSAWGVELCKRISSPNFKLLYDIYHMQIDEGDVIRTIQNNHQYFGHYHTGGVPGRNEIDETQELNYPAILKAIHTTGFTGYVAQEFLPSVDNPIGSLRKAIEICDI